MTNAILNINDNKDSYVIDVASGYFSLIDGESEKYKLYDKKDGNIIMDNLEINDRKTAETIIKQYEDKLPHYKFTLKKLYGAYQFEKIELGK